MATIQDVARHAGVSVSTISNALNGRTDRMRKETLERILQAIEILNYRPSAAARQLKTGHAPVLGLLVPSITNPMYAVLAQEIETIAKKEYGYRILLGNTYRQQEEEKLFLDDLLSHGVKGVIVVSSLAEQSHFQEATQRGLTLVNYDCRTLEGSTDKPAADNIYMDNVEAGHMAACHLLASGCQRIAFATASGRTISRRDKIEGFLAAAREAGLATQVQVIEGRAKTAYGDAELAELGIQLAREIAAMPARPDGVVAINDMVAIGLMAGLRQCALRVPEDISVIGIDDIPLAALVSPALTSVQPPFREMARVMVTRLMARLANPALPTEDFIFEPQLVRRESVRNPSA